jgi:signal transduction histidine kinase
MNQNIEKDPIIVNKNSSEKHYVISDKLQEIYTFNMFKYIRPLILLVFFYLFYTKTSSELHKRFLIYFVLLFFVRYVISFTTQTIQTKPKYKKTFQIDLFLSVFAMLLFFINRNEIDISGINNNYIMYLSIVLYSLFSIFSKSVYTSDAVLSVLLAHFILSISETYKLETLTQDASF